MSTSGDGFGDGGAKDFFGYELGSNFDEKSGPTQFHEACMYGYLNVVLQFLELGQDPNCLEQTASGIDPPLHLALRELTNGELVQTLLRAGADPNLVGKGGSTPLHVICRRPCFAFDMATVFFETCEERELWVPVNTRDQLGWTPLQLAVTAAKDCNLAELLLAKGANPMLADPEGRTSLQLVCGTYIDNEGSVTIQTQSRFEEVARSMLIRGADPTLANDQGETSLHVVAKEVHQLSIEFWYYVLLKISRDAIIIGPEWIDARNKSGCTPLHLVCSSLAAPSADYYQARVAEWLLRAGADPNAPNEHGATPLHLMQHNVFLAELFFEICGQRNRAVRINAQDRLGDTPLHVAAKIGCRSMTQLLLRKGADPNSLNGEGSTPLHEACKINVDSYLTQFLDTYHEVGRSVDINARDKNGDTALHLVLRLFSIDRLQAVFALLTLGADPNLANAQGRTVQHVIGDGRFGAEFVNDFLNVVCDESWRTTVQLDARDNEGNTPLHLALSAADAEVAEILLRRGADPTLVNASGETPLHVICRGCELDRTISTNLASIFFRVNDELQRHRISIDARDNWDQTPLQLTMMGLAPNTFDVLLDHGADLSNFVFQFDLIFYRLEWLKNYPAEMKLIFAICLLTLAESVERRGYVLYRSDAMTIMRVIDELGLFRMTVDPVTRLLDDEHFSEEAKKMMVKDDNSDSTTLHDLIQLPLKEAAKRFTHMDYYELIRDEKKLRKLSYGFRETSHAHLFEIMSKRFFLSWALELFMELIHCRLPILCCEMIIDNLNNEDLFNICLAVEGQKAQ